MGQGDWNEQVVAGDRVGCVGDRGRAGGRPRGALHQGAGDGATLTLNALLPDTTLSIRMHAEDFRVQGNCNVVAAGGGQTMLRWMLDEIVEKPTA